MKIQFYQSKISFSVNSTTIEFTIYHNLSKNKIGFNVDDIVDDWVDRWNFNKDFSDVALCKFIMDRDESFVAITEQQWKEMQLQQLN
jgi:hypothetical protein